MNALDQYRHIYFLGIGGIGMSALARYFILRGHQVSGYDRQQTPITTALEALGANISYEDVAASVAEMPDMVIYTPAIPMDSEIRLHFIREDVSMIKRSDALHWLTDKVETIAVAGTHGKTTTSSMISYLLQAIGIRHTAFLGGIAANYQSNFMSDGSELIVTEADEYDRSFLKLFPKRLVVTAMDADHLDIYGTHEAMIDSYRLFIRQIQPDGTLLYRRGLEEKIGQETFEFLRSKNVSIHSYAVEEGEYHASSLKVDRGVWSWDMITPDGRMNGLALHMPGRHNVENAIAACAMALEAGGDASNIIQVLPDYKGVVRRFEIRYHTDAHIIIDDYAHHPEELRAAITAAHETYGGEITGIFQPHLYSRTRDFAGEFAAALDLLDVPVIIDIYPAREVPIPGVSSQTIFDLMKNPRKQWLRADAWIEWAAKRKPRVLMTLGAGDLDKHIPELIRRMTTYETE